MKHFIRKFKLVLAAMLIVLAFSCSSEDGAIGPAGPAGTNGVDGNGTNGTDGTNGEDGENGEDGNANVITTAWQEITFPATWDINDEARFAIADIRITQDVIDNYALLGYVRFTNASRVASSIPFISLGQDYQIHDAMIVGEYVCTALVNDIALVPTPPINLSVRYVLIQAGTTSKSSNKSPYQQLLDAGVDTTNYNDVMQYLNKI